MSVFSGCGASMTGKLFFCEHSDLEINVVYECRSGVAAYLGWTGAGKGELQARLPHCCTPDCCSTITSSSTALPSTTQLLPAHQYTGSWSGLDRLTFLASVIIGVYIVRMVKMRLHWKRKVLPRLELQSSGPLPSIQETNFLSLHRDLPSCQYH